MIGKKIILIGSLFVFMNGTTKPHYLSLRNEACARAIVFAVSVGFMIDGHRTYTGRGSAKKPVCVSRHDKVLGIIKMGLGGMFFGTAVLATIIVADLNASNPVTSGPFPESLIKQMSDIYR